MIESYYKPGVCNISQAEVDFRRVGGILFAVLTVLFVGLLIIFKAHPMFGLTVLIPSFTTTTQLLQSHYRFCVTNGRKGRYSTKNVRNMFTVVEKAEDKALDRRRARTINYQSLAISVAVTIATVVLLSLQN